MRLSHACPVRARAHRVCNLRACAYVGVLGPAPALRLLAGALFSRLPLGRLRRSACTPAPGCVSRMQSGGAHGLLVGGAVATHRAWPWCMVGPSPAWAAWGLGHGMAPLRACSLGWCSLGGGVGLCGSGGLRLGLGACAVDGTRITSSMHVDCCPPIALAFPLLCMAIPHRIWGIRLL
jgi:hypothetical protein